MSLPLTASVPNPNLVTFTLRLTRVLLTILTPLQPLASILHTGHAQD